MVGYLYIKVNTSLKHCILSQKTEGRSNAKNMDEKTVKEKQFIQT